jgi:hypothetical protein
MGLNAGSSQKKKKRNEIGTSRRRKENSMTEPWERGGK